MQVVARPVESPLFQYVELVPLEPARSLVVVGLPSRHLGGVVAAAFLIEQLEMTIVGEFTCDLLPPAAVSYDGLVVGPIQVWSTECDCGFERDCARLLVVKGDIPITPALMPSLADAVVAWAKGVEASSIVALDELDVDRSDVQASAVSNAGGRSRLKDLGAPRTPDTILTGLGATILTHADEHKLPALAIHAHRFRDDNDARSAARLVRHVAPLLPPVGIDAEKLVKRASHIEDVVHALQRKQATESRLLADRANRGYA